MMKTDSKIIKIEEIGLDIQDGQNMITNLINNQINNYKLKYLIDWERNHNISPNDKDQKIEQLEKVIEELSIFLSKKNSDDYKLSLSINLDLIIPKSIHKTSE